jgi:hypothetical protein
MGGGRVVSDMDPGSWSGVTGECEPGDEDPVFSQQGFHLSSRT